MVEITLEYDEYEEFVVQGSVDEKETMISARNQGYGRDYG